MKSTIISSLFSATLLVGGCIPDGLNPIGDDGDPPQRQRAGTGNGGGIDAEGEGEASGEGEGEGEVGGEGEGEVSGEGEGEVSGEGEGEIVTEGEGEWVPLCVTDDDCAATEVCNVNTCVVGCRAHADCPTDQVCDLREGDPIGVCFAGCAADVPTSCHRGTHCEDGACALGCNGDDARCGAGHVCDVDDICRRACTLSSDCGSGETCMAGACHDGCQLDADCGGSTPTCDVTDGVPGSCVECVENTDCAVGSTCDVSARMCRVTCGVGGVCAGSDVCDLSANLCVECLTDEGCNAVAGEVCDDVTQECVVPPFAQLQCRECDTDADCGGGSNHCAKVLGPNHEHFEWGCAEDCSNGASCPDGFSCRFIHNVDTIVVGQACMPYNSVIGFPTCAAYRDLVERETCNVAAADLCGRDSRDDDAICLAAQGLTQGVCSLPCTDADDCPDGFGCTIPAMATQGACTPG